MLAGNLRVRPNPQTQRHEGRRSPAFYNAIRRTRSAMVAFQPMRIKKTGEQNSIATLVVPSSPSMPSPTRLPAFNHPDSTGSLFSTHPKFKDDDFALRMDLL